MENLTISDPPPPMQQHGGPGGMPPALGRPPPPPQQLPAQMFTTAAQLLDLTDSKYFRPMQRSFTWSRYVTHTNAG